MDWILGGSGWEALHWVPASASALGSVPVSQHYRWHQGHTDPIPVNGTQDVNIRKKQETLSETKGQENWGPRELRSVPTIHDDQKLLFHFASLWFNSIFFSLCKVTIARFCMLLLVLPLWYQVSSTFCTYKINGYNKWCLILVYDISKRFLILLG